MDLKNGSDVAVENVAEVKPEKPKKDPTKYDVPIVSRKEWDAVPPKSVEPLPRPVEYVFLTLTNTPECRGKEECTEAVKKLQTHYMEEKGLADIPYNFLIGKDGTLLEGRGWTTLSHQLYDDHLEIWKDSMDIAFIHDYSSPVSEELKQAAYSLIKMGVRRKHIERLHVVDICKLHGIEDLSILGADENRPRKIIPKEFYEMTNEFDYDPFFGSPFNLFDEEIEKPKKKKSNLKKEKQAKAQDIAKPVKIEEKKRMKNTHEDGTPQNNTKTGKKERSERKGKVMYEDIKIQNITKTEGKERGGRMKNVKHAPNKNTTEKEKFNADKNTKKR